MWNHVCTDALGGSPSRSNFELCHDQPPIIRPVTMDSVDELIGWTELSTTAPDAVIALDDLDDLLADKESLAAQLGDK